MVGCYWSKLLQRLACFNLCISWKLLLLSKYCHVANCCMQNTLTTVVFIPPRFLDAFNTTIYTLVLLTWLVLLVLQGVSGDLWTALCSEAEIYIYTAWNVSRSFCKPCQQKHKVRIKTTAEFVYMQYLCCLFWQYCCYSYTAKCLRHFCSANLYWYGNYIGAKLMSDCCCIYRKMTHMLILVAISVGLKLPLMVTAVAVIVRMRSLPNTISTVAAFDSKQCRHG